MLSAQFLHDLPPRAASDGLHLGDGLAQDGEFDLAVVGCVRVIRRQRRIGQRLPIEFIVQIIGNLETHARAIRQRARFVRYDDPIRDDAFEFFFLSSEGIIPQPRPDSR